jgi:hypothetical protein
MMSSSSSSFQAPTVIEPNQPPAGHYPHHHHQHHPHPHYHHDDNSILIMISISFYYSPAWAKLPTCDCDGEEASVIESLQQREEGRLEEVGQHARQVGEHDATQPVPIVTRIWSNHPAYHHQQ